MVIAETTNTYTSLTSKQKESIGLLSTGTFLEYFDFFLYVHMAVFLNEYFFPKTDPHTSALLTAFAFCSTYVLRPLGALIFGYLGDNIGRKSTVVITTSIMALSCIVMANLPTYAQVGISAAYIVTIVRIAQGMASMGEVIGAEIYIMEVTRPPIQYSAVALIAVVGVLGGTVALGVATLITYTGFNWRLAFWFGAIVAVVGGIARNRLSETPEFLAAKQKQALQKNKTVEKVDKKSALALFLIHASWPVCFYFAYMYCGDILKNNMQQTAAQIIHQNFIVSMLQLLSWFALVFMSYKFNPLKIVRIRLAIFAIFIIVSPILFKYASSPMDILFIQSMIVVCGFMGIPVMPVLYKHFPVFKRFTFATFTYALSRALVYIFTSFGLVYLSDAFGHWVSLLVMTPVAIVYWYSIRHFARLEQETAINIT